MELRIFCDGGSRGNPGPGACAFVALDAQGKLFEKRGLFLGKTTNNQAEYQGVLLAFTFLAKQKSFEFTSVIFLLDSELVVNQLNGRFRIRDKNLQRLVIEIKKREKVFGPKVIYRGIPREQNKLADLLVNKILDQYT